MQNIQIVGVSLYDILNWFFIYSFLGWLWESCFVSIRTGKPVNRGFINGPFCTIYGFGAISVYLLLKPFDSNLLLLYIGGVIVPTILEYLTGWLMETIFHTRWWDYSNNKFNFQGRICLQCSLGWGVFTIVLFKVLHPFVIHLVSFYSVSVGQIAVSVIGVLYLADFTTSAVAAFGLPKKFVHVEAMLEEFSHYLQTTKLYETTEEIKDRIEESKQMISYRALLKRFEIRREELMKRFEAMQETADANYTQKKAEFGERFDEFSQKYTTFRKKQGIVSKRMMRAYPNLSKSFKKNQEKRKKKNP